jgi:hypothetical protein
MANYFYDDYSIDPEQTPLDQAACVLENVTRKYTGDRVSGFVKITNSDEMARLRADSVTCYDPDQQRGKRIRWKEGEEVNWKYIIKPSKVKEIARSIAENRAYNRVRTVNCRYGHVRLWFEPYDKHDDGKYAAGRLYVFAAEDSPFSWNEEEGTGLKGVLTMPDSAHRQAGDSYFTEQIATRAGFNPEFAGFTPDTYDLTLEITLADVEGEGFSHYEHNELITKSTATRRNYLEGGQVEPANWVGHELLRINRQTEDLVEKVEASISKNSPKLLTFSTLVKGIEEGWGGLLSGDRSLNAAVARHLDAFLRLSREVVPEWGPMPFNRRKAERETMLYSQAIILRGMLRVFAEWHHLNELEGRTEDVARWRPVLRKLKTPYEVRDAEGKVVWKSEFLDRRNPVWSEAGGGIFAPTKSALDRKAAAEAQGRKYVYDPLKDLSVVNTRQSLAFAHSQLRALFGHKLPDEAAAAGGEDE